MRIFVYLLAALLFLETPAVAASEPVIAPRPEWVESVSIPNPNPVLADRPLQGLLLSTQSQFGPEHYDHYIEYAMLIQTPLGLQAAGNITIPWQPDQSDLFVHQVKIVRGNEVIDLLASGQTFTVLRRESNLETAMLDGILTAVMQPEGLSVGDVLSVAFTIRLKPGTIGLRGENFLFAARGFPMRRISVRQIWPASMEMRWRGTGLYEEARTRTTSLGTELVFEGEDVEGPELPSQAPARFMMPATLEVSAYSSWSEISRAFVPLYDRASELAPESPVGAVIDRIAASSPDPHARAMAALRLVQDEVRYLALAMGEGHLLPATADQTWRRRYGDCKGKTALLLALLRGLGIEAEPVLVNSLMGDALDDRLPQVAAFDHVIVRARIDGTSYWLDGTRTGDRSIEDLAAASFSWGLPLRDAGAELEPIPVPAPRLPTSSRSITYDASQGFSGTVPVRAEISWRGDTATMMRMAVAQAGRDAFLQQLRNNGADYVPAGSEITSLDIADDDGSGGWTLTITGSASMNWRRLPGHQIDEFRFDNSTIDWNPNVQRAEGEYRDTPFAFDVPVHLESTETIILPNRGRGFTIDGSSFDRTIAGVRLMRDVRIVDGRAVSRTVFRRLQREVPAREMRAAIAALRAITDDDAFLRAPEGTRVRRTSATSAAGGSSGRQEAGQLIDRGYQLIQSGDLRAAATVFTEAAELAPQWSRPHANHAIVLIHQNDHAAAEALLDRAEALNADDFVVPQGRGMIHLARGEAEAAIAQFTRSLELDANNRFNLLQRSAANRQAGRIEAALADLDEVLAGDPGDMHALTMKARLLAWQGGVDEALALVDARVATDPANVGLFELRAAVLSRGGRAAEARQAYSRALEKWERRSAQEPGSTAASIRSTLLARAGEVDRAVTTLGEALEHAPDNAGLLNERCWTRAIANIELEEALADCERAVELQPRTAAYIDSRAMVRLRLGQYDKAIEDATAALAIAPRLAASLFVRGVARIRHGDTGGGEADLAAARQIEFDIDSEYREYGVTP